MAEARSLYNEVILDHIKNARNFQALADADRKSHGINPLCGDTFNVYVKLEGDRIAQAAFECECCGISMASASIMTEAVKGRSVADVKALLRHFEGLMRNPGATSNPPEGAAEIAMLELIADFPSRVNCALLGWHTLEAALDGRENTTLGG
ncbi:MAG TPA: SUF system NifU family Fe-S cluster assembly protein [Hyphomicrobiaceae bacterium]|nr:SUF system NifU family Fe-S cluster assembly protein [Hyphomicrobiaceae bacterium]